LIEGVVAFALTVILILGTAQLTLHSLSAKRTADMITEAAELAAAKLEHMKSKPFESHELEESEIKESLPGRKQGTMFLRECRVRNLEEGVKWVEVDACSESFPLRKVRIGIFLLEGLGF